MAETATIIVRGGPYTATAVTSSAIVPPNTFVGRFFGDAETGMPTALSATDGNEVLQDGATGFHVANDGSDYYAVSQPGVYLVTWTFEATASVAGPSPATGPLGAIVVNKTNGLSTFVDAGGYQTMDAVDEGTGDTGVARGGGSAIVWLGTSSTFEDGLRFGVAPNSRTDLINGSITVKVSATLLQAGGTPYDNTGG